MKWIFSKLAYLVSFLAFAYAALLAMEGEAAPSSPLIPAGLGVVLAIVGMVLNPSKRKGYVEDEDYDDDHDHDDDDGDDGGDD